MFLTTAQLSNIKLPLSYTAKSVSGISLYHIINSYLKLFPTNKVVINTSAPQATATTDTGAGTGSPTVTVSGNKYAGIISLTTGSAPATSATIATIDLKATAPTQFIPILTPANAATAAETIDWSANGTTTGFTILSGSTALTASTNYKWYYAAYII
jgi:hypothetical protein